LPAGSAASFIGLTLTIFHGLLIALLVLAENDGYNAMISRPFINSDIKTSNWHLSSLVFKVIGDGKDIFEK
jgi:hypothetical protein